MAAATDVTVVVPVHGDRGALRRTLDHLRRQVYDGSVEVLVVDNGDNGDPAALAALVAGQPGARLLHEPTPGSYRARNTGVGAARGAVLAFTDADCLPSAHWLAEGLAALDAAGPGSFVGGRVRMVVETGAPPTLGELWQLGNDLRQDLYVGQRGWSATANLLVRAADFHAAGAFDGALESGGDRQWGERAGERGLRAVYAERAVVEHPARGTLRGVHTKVRRVTRGAVARRRGEGVPMHPGGLLGAARPTVRSAWRRSAAVADEVSSGGHGAGSGAGTTATRCAFVAVSLWVQYYRLGYGLVLLTRPEAP